MLEVRGNLWQYGDASTIRVITTNGFVKSDGRCVMGRGCAKEARDSLPDIDLLLGSLIKQHGNRAFRLSPTLATMPVKHVWWDKADPNLIVQSAHQLVAMADKFGWTKVLIPRPGCGNGQLSWKDVKPLLAPILDDRFAVITF